MTESTDVTRGREIIARWLDVAERRLSYLADMFESGRWRRYYSEAELLQNVRETRTAIDGWRALLEDVSHQDFSGDVSWLGRPRIAKPIADVPMVCDVPQLADHAVAELIELSKPQSAPVELAPIACVEAPQLVELPPSVESEILLTIEPEQKPREPVPASAPEPAWQNALDLDLMQRRYPLLRNAFF